MMNNNFSRLVFMLGLAVVICAPLLAAPKRFKVEGAGWWEGRLIERALRDLHARSDHAHADANAIEDAVFFTLSSVAEKGFLRPTVTAEVERVSGEVFTHEFDADFNHLLPRPIAAQQVILRIERGKRYVFDDVTVTGAAPVISDQRAKELLVPPTGLLPSGEARAFTPDRLQAGLNRIELVLRDEGYAEAIARSRGESMDAESGLVDVAVDVTVGPQWWVRSVSVEAPDSLPVEWPEIASGREQVYTLTWAQDQAEMLRRLLLPIGYPDVRVQVERLPAPLAEGKRAVDVTVRVEPGEFVEMGDVRYVGAGNVNARTLQRRVNAEPGEPLDVLALEQARRRLSRLSAFRRVTFDYDPAQGSVRSPVFTLERRPPWETSLLMGWGSYEKLRGGFEVAANNIWARSHQLRMEAMASLRSQRGDLIYSVPEILGESIDGSFGLFGLDRDEFAFQRQEYGATAGLSRRDLPLIRADGSLSYTFQNLSSRDNELASRATDTTESRSASVTLTLNRDRRNNPLTPTEGYRWFTQLEVADQMLGGEVGYQRVELGVSWHRPLADTNWIHVGLTQGTVWTLGESDDTGLPVNKRFFPGGEHSYRGTPNGEASPVDAKGEYIGAKSVTLLNVELEQALTTRFLAVVFVDALAATAEFADSPWDDTLWAVGGGLRYNTIIGPVRLEYGHNLNPRPIDPQGTLHFSIGFPF